ncbi:tudor domain-containing protein 15 [Tiliqua scincoides]|uniref:tudor domain-containing protein 15 n=1 Tax=Tiliqua scincoides TaxID=71010 RepID=UPI003462D0DB
MDSSPSTKFLDVDLKITDIYYHPKEILVKFQGQYDIENDFDYHILQREIQQVSKVKDTVGIGEFCLIEDPNCGEWYRGRVAQKKNRMYEVFLMDSGKILAVHETHIASAVDELFQLPPKMVCGIFANILPEEEKWGPKAFNYFSSLINLQIKGHVQAILPHQTFLLDVPKITNDLVELKLGRLVDGDTFHLIVEMLSELPQENLCKQMPDLLQQKYTRPDSVFYDTRIQPDVQSILSSFQPLLSVGGVEKVKISVAVSSSKFYCQLLQRQMELDELTTNMSSYYESIRRESVPSWDNLGALCAVRKKNGHWHRGVIQQLLTDNKVRIWFMDFGSYEAVPSSCILKLQQEFISVPIFSFPCALSCLSDQDETVRHSQLKEFKEALLRQSAIYVHIDLFNSNEHLYYVTLHKRELAVNSEFLPPGSNVVPKHCPSEIAVTSRYIEISREKSAFPECVPRDTLQPGNYSDENNTFLMDSPLTIAFKRAEIKIGSVYVAFVEYVLNPSNFWIHTNDYQDVFEDLMNNIADVYDSGETCDKILENPEPGKLCCARYSKDMHFYRAIIMEVVDNINCIVYFLDFGNTETVPLFDVKVLLPEFQKLPALAICCSLANAFSVEDVWIKKATDYFKKIVFGQSLTVHIITEQNNKYSVNVQCMNGSEQGDLLTFMVQAGYAEYWEVKKDPTLNVVRGFQVQRSKSKNKNKQVNPPKTKNRVEKPRGSGQNKKPSTVPPVTKESAAAFPQCQNALVSKCERESKKSDSLGPYREYLFKPGTVFDVVCCHSVSPGDFVCHIQTKLPELNNLMEQIQFCYNTQINQYESGQLACVVKHSKDGKWYRAAVLKHVSEMEVDVVLVDYGSYERVLLKDIQAITPDFLILECQAIRCCLSIVTESLMFDPDNWTSKACRDFEYFVSASDGQLSCTICARILRSPNRLYNMVDLQTPFVNAQQFLLESGHTQLYSFECARLLVPSFSLCTFYYSSFNMKLGNEEEVCITHMHSPSKFYCQLNRNADDIDKLLRETAEISQTTRFSNQISTHGLCLAKYFEDGLFYRALIPPLGSSNFLPVYFVDFGNEQLVAKEELIPIPDHASEILFTPMQAIKCYLSDLKDTDIPVEISAWFEKNCLGKELKAVIVSKESDGQLGVELYDNDLQINRKIKELLEHTKCDMDPKDTNKPAQKSVGNKNKVHKRKLGAVKAKVKNEVVPSKRERQNNINSCYHDQVRAEYEKKIEVNLQEQCSSPEQLLSDDTEISQNVLQDQIVRGICGELRKESDATVQKYTNLAQRSIQPNSKMLAYVSSGTSPSSFSIYLAEDENIIVQLAEVLNGGTLALDPATGVTLEEGDIVLAEYESDCCIYRAVIKGVISEKLYQVEFIDYGNISTVTASKIYRMEEVFLNYPRLSICCFLTTRCVVLDIWSSDIAAYFISKVNNQPLVCEFLQQHGQVWEVDVFINGVSMSSELIQKQINLDSHIMPILELDKIAKHLPVTDINNDAQSKKSESQNAHEAFEPMPAWENLPKIAHQKIKPGQVEIVEISYVSSDGNFYVNLINDLQTLSSLHMMAAQEGENSLLFLEDIKEGSECLTKSKETLQWYRSEVIKLPVDEDNMLVFFLDMGKYEIVSLHDVRMLSREIRSIPRNAVLCKWAWVESLHGLSFESVAEMIKCHEIKILFLRYLQAFIWEVDILIDGILLLEHWKQCFSCKRNLEKCNISRGVTNKDRKMAELSLKLNSIPWTQFQNGRSYPGFVTSVTDPSNFCIQLEDSFKYLKALFKEISEVPFNLPVMPRDLIVPGAICLIKVGSSDEWNRVEVSEVSDLVIMLTFIDDGFSAAIPVSDIQKLTVIPEKLVNIPRLTYPCSLYGVSPTDGKNWNNEAKLKVQEFLGRQGLVFHLKQYHYRTKLEVDVFCEQNSAADVLVASGCAAYSKTASSVGSINCSGIRPLNLHILCDPLQKGGQTSSVARMTLLSEKEEVPPKSDLQFKCACDRISKRSSKRRFCKGKGWQDNCFHSNKRSNKKDCKYDKSLCNQPCDKKRGQSSIKGILSEALHKMHDLQLRIQFDRMKIHE